MNTREGGRLLRSIKKSCNEEGLIENRERAENKDAAKRPS
jgi:hypothetical protein